MILSLQKIVKNIVNFIVKPITFIFNLSSTTGEIPEALKVALVTPVYKAGQ